MKPIKQVVVLGGGTAGWLSAALLKKVLGDNIHLTLVESDDIGTVGVGEATIPPIRLVNNVLGLNEAEFVRETKATIKLAIRFENWQHLGQYYYHTFGAPGRSMAFCHFHHLWARGKALGITDSLWQYDLNYHCCEQGSMAIIDSRDPLLELPYAYHFDAGLYAQYLRKLSENMGVIRREGEVTNVLCDDAGNVASLTLKNGDVISGDMFIDCSGFKALLIEQTLGTGYDDWSHWLPCDRAIAVPSERHAVTAPFTRSIARAAGWQWRIPLQHRNGNGHVFCSRYMSEDEATHVLMSHLDTPALGEPRVIRFTTGRRRKQWHRNVVAIGLSSGFLEPLESTSIHLIQSGIVRLLQLFPHNGIPQASVDEYNKQSRLEFEQIRDFLVLHYYLNERNDSRFWRDRRHADVPPLMQHKLALFHENGKLFRDQNDLFLESSWLQVMMGQGVTPRDIHPAALSMPDEHVITTLARLKQVKSEPASQFPKHDEFLARLMRM